MANTTCVFVNGYTEAISKAFDQGGPLDCAVAFWGADAIPLLQKATASPIRIICNLESGATNPSVVEAVNKIPRTKVSIRTNGKLHAKVLVAKDHAIIGSANISANGLSLEDEEIKGWIEAGCCIRDQQEVEKTAAWFDELWRSSKDIAPALLARAKKLWEQKRRKVKVIMERPPSLLQLLKESPETIRDKNLHIVICGQDTSDAAERAFETKYGPSSRYEFYEDWEDLPDDAPLIEFAYDAKTKKVVGKHDLYRMPEDPIIEPVKNNGRQIGSIKLCLPERSFGWVNITAEDIKALKNAIPAVWEKRKGVGSTNTKGIHEPVYRYRNLILGEL